LPLFPDSYHRDTTHLTTEEHGAYLLLLMAAWGNDDCSLPDDEKRLAALAKLPLARWRKVSATVLEFWTREKGRIRQKRLSKEWLYVREKRAQAKAAIEARWKRERASGRHSDVRSGVIHLGGGGGDPFQEGNSTDEVGDTPLHVIEGSK
jgi:uncharacterized protein YdaU (DUF1376 family)